MPKVRTLKQHYNDLGDSYEKNPGKLYEVSDKDAADLIASGLVEEVKPAKESKKH